MFKAGEKKELNSDAPPANQVFTVHLLQLNQLINQYVKPDPGARVNKRRANTLVSVPSQQLVIQPP